ncbi:hypothetical protein MHU86_22670 [Fragilaria crotonensis]|nr:hypothetical protein MHU86_22670 [Fragilaria crotonensis]
MPIYGTGQGSGNSPMIWCFLSSLLFDCYDLRASPAQYCNPDWTNRNQVSMIGFVDDSNGQVNSFFDHESPETLQALIEKARTNAIAWSELLHATGGALELTKCSYHVAFWKFSSQGAPVLSNISREIPPLHILDPFTGQEQVLEYLPPSVAHKTLGHYKEPMGLQKMQFRQLKAKVTTSLRFFGVTIFTRDEAWTFYRSCYIPAVVYPLTSSFLSQSQLKHIQGKAMSIITAKCGFNRNTKTEVLYGPKDLGGADFRHLIVQQGISQTMYFLRHWRSQSSTAVTLSDIAKPNGCELDPSMLCGQPSLMSNRTRWHTVNQDRPSEIEWKLWKSANRLWSDEKGVLFQALGEWTQPSQSDGFNRLLMCIEEPCMFSMNTTPTQSIDTQVITDIGHQLLNDPAHTPSYQSTRVPQKSLDTQGYWKLHGNPSSTFRSMPSAPSASATFELFEFTFMHEPWIGILATDSQGVLDTLQEGDHDPQEQEVPVDLDRGEVILDCLRPDWDILIEIQLALKQLPRVALQYVKGHQDDKVPYHSLDLLGQLNVDADTQAGLFNREFGAYRGHVIMSPAARAHLCLPRTVTSRYPVLLHEATTTPLLDYIRRKHGWDASTLHSIHWGAHALAIKKTMIPHTHLVKLLHRMLPTHAMANKFDGGTRTCPLCGSTHEDSPILFDASILHVNDGVPNFSAHCATTIFIPIRHHG